MNAQRAEHRRKITKTITVKILKKNRWTWFYVYKKSKIILLVFGKQTMHPCESIRVRHWTLLKLKKELRGFQQEERLQGGSGKAPITVHFIHQIITFTTFNLASLFLTSLFRFMWTQLIRWLPTSPCYHAAFIVTVRRTSTLIQELSVNGTQAHGSMIMTVLNINNNETGLTVDC